MSLQPLFPMAGILLGFILLLGGLSWLEVRRPGRWQTLRLTALVLALSAVAALLLRPALEKTGKISPILLLTPGFETGSVDSLLRVHPGWELYRTAGTESYGKSVPLEDPVELSGLDHRITAIVGEGLPAYALEYLRDPNFQYVPPVVIDGVEQVTTESYTEKQRGKVYGTYRQINGAGHRLVLESPEGPVDSVPLTGSGLTDFTLHFTPLTAGNWQYQLVEKDSNDQVLRADLLPIRVEPEKQLHILILQAFPTFEVRYLKDFLADRGHAVAVRSQISRNNFRTEFANLSSRDLGRLTTSLLEDFDLLIADDAAFSQIGQTELYSLESAIEQGLGLLGLVNGDNAGFRRWLGLTRIAAQADTVQLPDGIQLPAYAVNTFSDLDWYPLQETAVSRRVAAYHYRGKGKIGYQTVQESYAALLRGDSLAYAALWMPVLEGSIREAYVDYTIELVSEFPHYAGEPLDFRITANQMIEEVLADGREVAMREDSNLPDVWYGRCWPDGAGWHQIEVGEERLEFYAFQEGAWPSLRRARIRQQTFNLAKPAAAIGDEQKIVTSEPISRLWFYGLFLVSAGFLWLAPKL